MSNVVVPRSGCVGYVGGGLGLAWAPGWTVGMPRVNGRAASEMSARMRNGGAEPVDPALFVRLHDLVGGRGRHVRVLERGLEILVGHERDAACELRLRLRDDAVRERAGCSRCR